MSSAASIRNQVSLPTKRGLTRAEAAQYIGISPNTFDKLVNDGAMPQPKRVFSRKIWDLRALDSAFDLLDSDELDQSEANPLDTIESI